VHEIEWKSPAIADLLQIIDYVSDDNPNAAQALNDDIETKVANLAENPRLYKTGRVSGTREMVVLPNYIVVYQETPNVVSVLRILHAARQWP
jgi:toxin ParE1/3/4